MSARSFHSILVASAKKILTGRQRPRRTSLCKPRLSVEPLERRDLPTVLGPRTGWSDAYTDTAGVYHPGTIRVFNDSSTSYVDVTLGVGSASLAPAGGDYYAVTVTGLSGYAGDSHWSGEAANLSLNATGSIAGVTISGDMQLYAGGDIGPLSGHIVSAQAGGSIGNLSGTDSVVAVAGGSIGNISAKHIGAIKGGGTVGAVHAAEEVFGVTAGSDVALVTAGTDIGQGAPYTIIAGQYVYAGVHAGHSVLGEVTAGGSISSVSAGADLVGPVTAGSTIGTISAGTWPDQFTGTGGILGDILGAVSAGSITSVGNITSVSASHDIIGTVTATNGSIREVFAGGSVRGEVHADTTIGTLAEPTDPDPNGRYWIDYPYGPYGPYPGVRALGDIVAPVTADVDIVGVAAAGTVSGRVSAGRDIGWVMAGLDLAGEVTAGRDLGTVAAGSQLRVHGGGPQPAPTVGSLTGSVTTGRTLYAAIASGDLGGTLRAGGAIGEVIAQGSISANIQATGGMGGGETSNTPYPYSNYSVYFGSSLYYYPIGGGPAVQAGQDYTGSLSAGGTIWSVSAGRDLGGTIHAGGDLPTLTAGRTLSTTADASGRINTVTATNDITGSVTAGGDIGRVQAGTWGTWSYLSTPPPAPTPPPALGNISGSVSAAGGVYDVLASGNISGGVTAGRSIGRVYAGGSISGRFTTTNGAIGDSTWWTGPPLGAPTGYYGPGGGATLLLVSAAIGAGWDFTGSATAGGSASDIVGVWAGHDLGGRLTAGRDITSIQAEHDVLVSALAYRDIQAVSAGGAHPGVSSPVAQIGSVTGGTLVAVRDIWDVEASGDILIPMEANRGSYIGPWHGIGRVAAYGTVGGVIMADEGSVGTLADAPAYSFRDGPAVWAALEDRLPPFWQGLGRSWLGVHAGLDVTALVSGTDVVSVDAGRDITGAIWANRDVGWVRAGRSVTSTATIRAYGGDVYSVWAGGLPGDSAEPGDMAARLYVGHDVHRIYATQDVAGSIWAGHGVESVTAGRDVTMSITATASVGRLGDRNGPDPAPG